jgi:hypothetical protein
VVAIYYPPYIPNQLFQDSAKNFMQRMARIAEEIARTAQEEREAKRQRTIPGQDMRMRLALYNEAEYRKRLVASRRHTPVVYYQRKSICRGRHKIW